MNNVNLSERLRENNAKQSRSACFPSVSILCVYNHESICKSTVESILSKFYLSEEKSVILKIAFLHTVLGGYMGFLNRCLMVKINQNDC